LHDFAVGLMQKKFFMRVKEWFKDWFNSPYYDLLYHYRNEEEARGFIDLLMKYLQPKLCASMLDVACGKGRHSKCLSDMGFDVTGFDLSENSIASAKKFENEHLHFYVHDMRRTFWINYFDYAFNFFTSFGYFNTRREDDDAMRTIVQSLNSNGIFVIDYLNVHYVEDNFVRSEVKIIDGIKFYLTRWQDENHFYKQVQVEDENHAMKHCSTEKVSKFSLGDITEMLAYQSLQVVDVFGDYQLGKYDVRKSPRMIVVGKKVVK
jgi:SAM-dependent methyltransferase